MLKVRPERAWVEVDAEALRSNCRALQQRLPRNCRMMPAVKANAYGHGAIEISRILLECGIRDLAVASLDEAAELRGAGIDCNILILGYTDPRLAREIAELDVIQAIPDASYAAELSRIAVEKGVRVRAHVAVDTGMHRIGEPPERMDEIVEIYRLPGISVCGIFSHLCVSDEREPASERFTRGQADAFDQIACNLIKRGVDPGERHLCASFGILRYPEFCRDLQFARPGIALYGLGSVRGDLDGCGEDLKPVLSLYARVAQVRDVAAGDGAGYGLAFRAERPTKLATVTIGYADGVPRALSNGKGFVTVRGRQAKIVGRICMDQLLIDVTEIDGVVQGDVVTMLGTKAPDPTVYDWAEVCGTITHEIVTGLSARPRRIVV